MSALRDEIVSRLTAVGDPERAESQQRYMKSTMPFHGVATPDMRRIARAVFADHPISDADEWEYAVLELWRDATHREQRYVAVELADHVPYRSWLVPSRLPMIEEMIVTGAWWDFVDRLASAHLGRLLAGHRAEVRPVMWRWALDDDMWRRRSSILVQLRFKEATDTELLFHAVEASIDSRELFLRKAIGWALRTYSTVDPDTVVDFVTTNRDRLSALSEREALRVLRKQGAVPEIP